jgi:hypothetical protein
MVKWIWDALIKKIISIVSRSWNEKRENGCTCTQKMYESDRYIYMDEICMYLSYSYKFFFFWLNVLEIFSLP